MADIKIERKPDEQRLKDLGIADWPIWTKEESEFFLKSKIRNLQSTIITNPLTIATLAATELYEEIQR